jgi:hypothetical protein
MESICVGKSGNPKTHSNGYGHADNQRSILRPFSHDDGFGPNPNQQSSEWYHQRLGESSKDQSLDYTLKWSWLWVCRETVEYPCRHEAWQELVDEANNVRGGKIHRGPTRSVPVARGIPELSNRRCNSSIRVPIRDV